MQPNAQTERVLAPLRDITPYCGPAPELSELGGAWNLSPMLLAGLAAVLGIGVWRAGNRGAFAIGWAGLVIAFVSPLCALTTALFLARSAHHLLILGLAMPVLAIGLPLPRARMMPAFLILSAALCLWHLPAAYSLAWESHLVYWLLQLALVGGAWAFWSAVLAPTGTHDDRVLTDAACILGLGSVMSFLGALITFAPRPLYVEHIASSSAYGLSALADQQASGLVMWVPGMLLMISGTSLALRRLWLRSAAA